MRKHFQQMNPTEKAFIHGYIRKHAWKTFGTEPIGHFYDRAANRFFSVQDATEALQQGLVIEVHNEAKDGPRALVRNQKGTCVVISLFNMRLVTVYYNDPEDKHETLNWAPYHWTQDLVELVKSMEAK